MTDEVVAYNAEFLFAGRGTANMVVKGKFNNDWFKKTYLKKYQHLTGKEESLTTNTLASTVMKYNNNDRISWFIGLNQSNANLTMKQAMEALNNVNKNRTKSLEFRYEDLLNNK